MKTTTGKKVYGIALVLGALAPSFGLLACDGGEREPVGVEESDELGESAAALGLAVGDCSSGTGFSATTKQLSIAMGSVSALTIGVVRGYITVNGHTCVDATSKRLAPTDVRKIAIAGTAGDDKVVVDLLTGAFGTTIFGATGGFSVDLGAGTGDAFSVRGSSGADKVTMGVGGADVYAEVTGDKAADIVVKGAEGFAVSLGAGDDSFTGAGSSAISAAHLTSGVTSLGVLSVGVTAYGGAGADTLQGGGKADTLDGGDGDDAFKSAATADGADVFVGGAGSDTVDYGTRTGALAVDVGPRAATAAGTVDLTALTLSTLDTETLVLEVDGGAAVTVTFAGTTTVASVLSQINAQGGGVVASLSSSNRLVLASPTAGAAGSLEVASGSAVAILGLTAGAYTVADGDDGLAGENDDVRFDVENIVGGAGADVLTGSAASNKIVGGAGNDTIGGGPGGAACAGDVDVLEGGAGDDKFVMGAAADCGDSVSGGEGKDTVDYQLRAAALTITVDGAANDGAASEADNVRNDVEVVIGGAANDAITGGPGADELHGGAGNDTLNGLAGDDVLYGNAGDDVLNGGEGSDTFVAHGTDAVFATPPNAGDGADVMNGGAGVDVVDYSGRTLALAVTLCVDASKPTGASTLTTGGCNVGDGESGENDGVVNAEWVKGGAGDDVITGGGADETLEGGAGSDQLNGGAGDDTLFGDAGDDTLHGNGGDDYLDDTAGTNVLDGDEGEGDVCIGTVQADCEL